MPGAAQFGIEQRDPYLSEVEYFRNNPHVAGMAAEDQRVVLNPFWVSMNGQGARKPEEIQSVLFNERARVFMKKHGLKPDFMLNETQAKTFAKYSVNHQDKLETVAARLLSGDPSAGKPTKKQAKFLSKLKEAMTAVDLEEQRKSQFQ